MSSRARALAARPLVFWDAWAQGRVADGDPLLRAAIAETEVRVLADDA